MKKLLLATLFTLAFTTFTIAQTTHTVNIVGFTFSPNNLTIMPGDIVNFNGLSGHSATEVSEANWNANIATSNGGFWLGQGSGSAETSVTLDEIGTYYYICIPHASMGMKGTITVVDPTLNTNEIAKAEDYSIINSGEGNYLLRFAKSDRLEVISITGKQMQSFDLSNALSQLEISLNHLASGVYLGVFTEKGESRKVIKFIR